MFVMVDIVFGEADYLLPGLQKLLSSVFWRKIGSGFFCRGGGKQIKISLNKLL